MKIYIHFILLIGTLFFTSCSKKEESTTAATAATPSAAITGETMSIGSTDYTRSLMSNCKDADWETDAGVKLYLKKQFWVYDNKSAVWNENHYSDSTCDTFVSSFVSNSVTRSSPMATSWGNASIVYKDTTWNFTNSTVKDNSSNVLDNATYYVLLYNGTCGDNTQGFHIIYPKSATEIQMTSGSCTTRTSSVNFSAFFPMEEVYTTQ
tara:strand:- start:99 stop:722 length:624 start_codon:yes stop_codon:yes gene_type:complete